MQEGIQLRVSDFIYAFKKRFKLIIIMFILGIIAGVALSGASYLHGTMSKSYRITSTAVFLTQNTSGSFSTSRNASYADLQMATDMVETVKYVIKSERMMNTVIDKTGLVGVNPSDISSNLEITQKDNTPVISLSLTWRSSEEGIQILTAIIDSSTGVMKDTLTTGRLSVIDEPTSRYIVGGNMSVPVWGVAAAAGLLIGIGFALLEVLLRPTLINSADVEPELGIELLGTIRKDDGYFKENTILPIRNIDTESEIIQDYSAIAYITRNRLDKRKDHHVLFVTSASGGEGTTSIASNLALQLAGTEHRTLLIDFNTYNPEIGGLMLGGIDYEHSLNALYRGDINEIEAVTKVNGYLDVLPALLERNRIPMDSAIFETIKEISEDYEYTIIDAPPIGKISGALSLSYIAETALFVIGFDMELKSNIRTAIDRLDKSGVRILGCVVNKETSGSMKDSMGGFMKMPKVPLPARKNNRTKKLTENKAAEDQVNDDVSAMTAAATEQQKTNRTTQTAKEEQQPAIKELQKVQVKKHRSSLEMLGELSEEKEPMSDEETLEALIEMELERKE